uniref:Uncharacterized protein n=1 Tax=Arundo donax TaxID=35708 RepID=A0A0A9ETP8_ARUDO
MQREHQRRAGQHGAVARHRGEAPQDLQHPVPLRARVQPARRRRRPLPRRAAERHRHAPGAPQARPGRRLGGPRRRHRAARRAVRGPHRRSQVPDHERGQRRQGEPRRRRRQRFRRRAVDGVACRAARAPAEAGGRPPDNHLRHAGGGPGRRIVGESSREVPEPKIGQRALASGEHIQGPSVRQKPQLGSRQAHQSARHDARIQSHHRRETES